MFKAVVAGLAALGAVSGTALAADATSNKPAHDWSGLYLGGFLGGSSGTLTGLGANLHQGPSGIDAGLHAYYSFQTANNWVFSPFVAIPIAGASGTIFGGTPVKVTWALVGGVKIGYAMDRWQPYGFAAGVVGGGSGGTNGSLGKATHTGYSVGLGVDYALTDRWSIGARYAYTAVGPRNYSGFSVGMNSSSIAATISFKLY